MSKQKKRARDEWSYRLTRDTFDRLDALIRAKWGHGAVRQLERQLKFSDGWWKKHREPDRTISLENTFRVLKEIGRHPREFFAEFPDQDTFRPIPTPEFSPPPIVKASQLHFSSGLGESDDAQCSALKKIENERFHDPLHTLSILEDEVAKLPHGQIPYLLCIAASCFRLVLEYDKAEICLDAAERMAGNKAVVRGHILQRWTYLLANMGYHDLALSRAEKSTILFSGIGNWSKVGESLVDRGWCHLVSKSFRDSLELYYSAWSLEEHLNKPNRISCLHGISSSLVRLGRPLEAQKYCLLSIEQFRNYDPFILGKSNYLAGIIEKALGNTRKSTDYFLASIKALSSSFPIDATIVSLDLAVTYLHLHELESARELISSISDQIRYFESVPQIRDLLLDLMATVALRRNLDLEKIKRLQKRIEKDRARLLCRTR